MPSTQSTSAPNSNTSRCTDWVCILLGASALLEGVSKTSYRPREWLTGPVEGGRAGIDIKYNTCFVHSFFSFCSDVARQLRRFCTVCARLLRRLETVAMCLPRSFNIYIYSADPSLSMPWLFLTLVSCNVLDNHKATWIDRTGCSSMHFGLLNSVGRFGPNTYRTNMA